MRKVRDYVIHEEIGKGAYSTVYKSFSVTDGRVYACKRFRRN